MTVSTPVALSFPRSREDLPTAPSKSLSLSTSRELQGLAALPKNVVSPPPLYEKDENDLAKSYASLSLALRKNSHNPSDTELQDLIAKDLDIGFKFFAERLKVNLSSCKVSFDIFQVEFCLMFYPGSHTVHQKKRCNFRRNVRKSFQVVGIYVGTYPARIFGRLS